MAAHDLFHDKLERLALHSKPKVSAQLRSTGDYEAERSEWAKPRYPQGLAVKGDFECDKQRLRSYDMDGESERCLKCADAPCIKGCPTSVDVHSFIYALSKRNIYEAARVIYTDNPLGLTCGLLCSTDHQCQATCNLRGSNGGPIDIGALQRYACELFHRMKIPQVVAPLRRAPYTSKIALIGSGPASLSCATYLARLGYSEITVLERDQHPGGVPSWIPEYRIPYALLRAEVAMVEELGVKIRCGANVGRDAVSALVKSNEFQALFIGAGLPQPFTLPFIDKALDAKTPNLWTATQFLNAVAVGTKDLQGPAGHRTALPELRGSVLVLGGGDVAFNAAGAALRLGASRTTLAFREDLAHRPCCREELLGGLLRAKSELVPNALPMAFKHQIESDPSSPITHVVLQLADWDKEASPAFDIGTQGANQITVRCDAVIVAFGSRPGTYEGLETSPRGALKVDKATQACSVPGVYAGGDCTGTQTVVKAVNSGKTAAWYIHKYLHDQAKIVLDQPPVLPPFRTPVDEVDVSVDLLGLHFINPFGLSSATPTGSIGQIRRAFEMGWGFAVTKTVLVVPNTNISPRINGTPFPHHGASKEGFVNIELLTEKTSAYWVQGVQELKREHPKHIVIMSIMGGNQSEWEKLAHVANESKADAVELNLSCPHVGKKGYGMLAGQAPESVEEITGWVRRLTKLPLVVKLTPNVTDITAIAAAAKRGGADAVTAINTVGGLMSIAPTGKPQPSVGVECRSAYGGCSGNMIRPLAFKAVTAIRRAIPDMPILGTGGCDSAESGLQFIQAGASVIQITSSIQNQDYAIISELVNGLKALLYLRGRSDLADWHHQTPPVALDSKPASVLEPKVPRPQLPVPTVASLLGITAKEIAVVPELDLQHQVIAKVDEDLCLRCGKCYLSCNDTGYHAIEFDPKTHIPRITTDCMGCGLCGSVCPASCISYVRKDFPHKPCRGIPDPSLKLPFDQ